MNRRHFFAALAAAAAVRRLPRAEPLALVRGTLHPDVVRAIGASGWWEYNGGVLSLATHDHPILGVRFQFNLFVDETTTVSDLVDRIRRVRAYV